jgi:hypothetical protein
MKGARKHGTGVVVGLSVACGVLCCVQHNHTLQELQLFSNSIGVAGATALAEALKVRRAVQRII